MVLTLRKIEIKNIKETTREIVLGNIGGDGSGPKMLNEFVTIDN